VASTCSVLAALSRNNAGRYDEMIIAFAAKHPDVQAYICRWTGAPGQSQPGDLLPSSGASKASPFWRASSADDRATGPLGGALS
jgi:hypothetical protein